MISPQSVALLGKFLDRKRGAILPKWKEIERQFRNYAVGTYPVHLHNHFHAIVIYGNRTIKQPEMLNA